MEETIINSCEKELRVFLAYGKDWPVEGKGYICKRVERSYGRCLSSKAVRTSPVQEFRLMAKDVVAVTTKNTCYITKIIGEDNYSKMHFIAIKGDKPEVGKELKCVQMDLNAGKLRTETITIAKVDSVEIIAGIYMVKSEKDIYVCLP